MIFVLLFFVIFSVASSLGLYFSVKKNLEMFEELEKTEQQFQEVVENLEFYYKRIEKKSKLELFSDDQIVRELVEDMKQIKNLISLISGSLEYEKDSETEQSRR